MANLTYSFLLKGFPHELSLRSQFTCHTPNLTKPRLASTDKCRLGRGRKRAAKRRSVACSSTTGEVGVVSEDESGKSAAVGQGQDKYLVRDFGWRVRRMVKVGEEMRKVAHVQAEAFYTPVAMLNDLFFDFFKAEVLSDLSYRVLNSTPERYACLVAESDTENNSLWEPQEIVGVADVTVQRDADVLNHIQGAEEYLYVSGIAVLTKFRRQKVATALLKACDVLSVLWGFSYMALRAYEDDFGARKLYSNAGYQVVSRDPIWVTWIGKRRRVLMVKRSNPVKLTSYE
ncbi:hypothetical protein Cni_G12328 [Canna indica]|uniref:N-acetyltransferase domain-containing protein n=1 Tax=Canna indica TaxID=4628 RepID=A0AAQ3KAG1_9LILI|nr:hypothetical protein Cni_G12328 [Canna indica]